MFPEIPWGLVVFMESHETPCDFIGFHEIPWIPWNPILLLPRSPGGKTRPLRWAASTPATFFACLSGSCLEGIPSHFMESHGKHEISR